MSSAKETIRTLFQEFSDVPDDTLDSYLEIFSPMVSKKKFGNQYHLALAYYIAHKMTVNGLGNTSENLLGGMVSAVDAAALRAAGVSSVRDGESALSFAADAGSAGNEESGNAAEYKQTVYGVQYLAIRDSCIVPITIA